MVMRSKHGPPFARTWNIRSQRCHPLCWTMVCSSIPSLGVSPRNKVYGSWRHTIATTAVRSNARWLRSAGCHLTERQVTDHCSIGMRPLPGAVHGVTATVLLNMVVAGLPVPDPIPFLLFMIAPVLMLWLVWSILRDLSVIPRDLPERCGMELPGSRGPSQ
jgi:hypothetical protein